MKPYKALGLSINAEKDTKLWASDTANSNIWALKTGQSNTKPLFYIVLVSYY